MFMEPDPLIGALNAAPLREWFTCNTPLFVIGPVPRTPVLPPTPMDRMPALMMIGPLKLLPLLVKSSSLVPILVRLPDVVIPEPSKIYCSPVLLTVIELGVMAAVTLMSGTEEPESLKVTLSPTAA